MVKNKFAFTIVECLITLSLIGMLCVITLIGMNKLMPDQDKVRFQKAYYTISKTVSQMINDDVLYPNPSMGFAYIAQVVISKDIDSFDDVSKFRNAFRFYAPVKQYGVNCATNDKSNKDGICFLLDSGAVVGIPGATFGSQRLATYIDPVTGEGAFKNTNVHLVKTDGTDAANGEANVFLPIYVYTSTKGMDDIANAYIVGVSKMGTIRLIPNVANADKYVEAQKYLKSTSMYEDSTKE